MTELYLVRHGETEWSKNGQHTSVTDLALTERGREQAKYLRGKLAPEEFDMVLSSPRRRAQETARLAGFEDFEIDKDLAEWAYGDYEGLTPAEIEQRNPGWVIWTDGAPGGESPEQATARYNRVLDKVEASGAKKVLIFAHGHALRAMTACWVGMPLETARVMPLDTARVSVLGFYRRRRALLRWNALI